MEHLLQEMAGTRHQASSLMTIRVQWSGGSEQFQGIDFHDSQMAEALQKCRRQWPMWPVVRIILIGDSPDDWVVLVDTDQKNDI